MYKKENERVNIKDYLDNITIKISVYFCKFLTELLNICIKQFLDKKIKFLKIPNEIKRNIFRDSFL